MDRTILRVHNAHVGYGRIQVLRGISIELTPEGNVGLFGPNGHGKTTLLRLISGLIKPTAGSVVFHGEDITQASPHLVVEHGIIHVSQGNPLFPDLTIAETLALGAHRITAKPKSAESLQLVFDLFPKLRDRYRQRVSTLSGGERQMVSIGMALMNAPEILLLDEPTLGLSPRVKEELCNTIHMLSNRGIPLILVEQDVEFLLALTNKLYFINHGKSTHLLSMTDRVSHAEIMEMYFGA